MGGEEKKGEGFKWKINNCFELAVLAFCFKFLLITAEQLHHYCKRLRRQLVCETVQLLRGLSEF